MTKTGAGKSISAQSGFGLHEINNPCDSGDDTSLAPSESIQSEDFGAGVAKGTTTPSPTSTGRDQMMADDSDIEESSVNSPTSSEDNYEDDDDEDDDEYDDEYDESDDIEAIDDKSISRNQKLADILTHPAAKARLTTARKRGINHLELKEIDDMIHNAKRVHWRPVPTPSRQNFEQLRSARVNVSTTEMSCMSIDTPPAKQNVFDNPFENSIVEPPIDLLGN